MTNGLHHVLDTFGDIRTLARRRIERCRGRRYCRELHWCVVCNDVGILWLYGVKVGVVDGTGQDTYTEHENKDTERHSHDQ